MSVKLTKHMFFLVLVFCITAFLLSFPVQASEIVGTGDCGQEGSDVQWTMYSDGTLTISGTGKMEDCYIGAYNEDEPIWIRAWNDHFLDIKSVVIEEGITYIGNNSFKEAENLISVKIADSVENIGMFAFYNCDSLTSITLGNGLIKTSIEIFFDCDALTDFHFPDSATKYGNHFLANCDNLKNVTLSPKMGMVYESMFQECKSLKNIVIPDGFTEIGSRAFSECSNLKQIAVPASVKRIGDNAFANCEKLESISLAEGLVEMSNSIFESSMALKEVTIPASVTTMAHTFQNAYSLESIKFLGHAPNFASNVFGNITATVYYPSNSKTWTETVRQNYGGTITWALYESNLNLSDIIASGICGDSLTWKLTDTNTLIISGTGDMHDAIGGEIPWYVYANKLEAVIIESGITSICGQAFYDCRALETVTLPDTITRLGGSCFHNCLKLKELVIPESVTVIESAAFCGCNSMVKIQFNGDAPKIDDLSFWDVTTTAYYPGSNRTWMHKLQNYGGTITWVPMGHVHEDSIRVTPPTCEQEGYTTYTCTCGDSYISDYVAAAGHTFEKGECKICGAQDPNYKPDVVEKFDIYGTNMTLGNSLSMNFFIRPADLEADETYYALITKSYADGADVVERVNQINWNKLSGDNGMYYVTLDVVAAKEMTDDVKVVVYNSKGEAVTNEYTDSVRTYTMRAMSKEEAGNRNMAKLAMYVDMLNYGAAAQQRFGYNVSDLANNQLSAAQKAYATSMDDVTMADKHQAGEGYVGTNLTLESDITMNFFFNNIPDAHNDMYAIATFTNHYGEEQEYRVEGAAFSQLKNDTRWYVPVKGIVVADYGQLVTVKVYNANGTVVASAIDSLESYIVRAMDKDPVLYEAIIKFATSAKEALRRS